jgi:hypothetical protein
MEILRLGWIDGQPERIKEFLSIVWFDGVAPIVYLSIS